MNRMRVNPIGGQAINAHRKKGPEATSFAKVLEAENKRVESGSLKFSAHATQRLQQAGRNLNETEMARIRAAVDRAGAKGSRESLVLMGDLALVVSVSNNTVITAVAGQRIRQNIFTNIDSAVIADGLDLAEGARGALYQSGPAALGGHEKI